MRAFDFFSRTPDHLKKRRKNQISSKKNFFKKKLTKFFLFSPLSTRCGFRGRCGSDRDTEMMETDSASGGPRSGKVSKNLLSLFDAGDSDDEFDF